MMFDHIPCIVTCVIGIYNTSMPSVSRMDKFMTSKGNALFEYLEPFRGWRLKDANARTGLFRLMDCNLTIAVIEH